MDEYTRPELVRSALLTIDVQNDFVLPGAPAAVAGTIDIIPNIQRLLLVYRQRRWPIVHIVRLYLPDGSNVDNCRRALIESGVRLVCPGSEGAELVAELKPLPDIRLDAATLLAGQLQPLGENEWALYKPRWGAFYKTRLEEHLNALGVNTVVVVGSNFPNCPRSTIYQAGERDLRIVAVDDALAGLYERGRKELQRIGVTLVSTDDFVSADQLTNYQLPTYQLPTTPPLLSIVGRSGSGKTTLLEKLIPELKRRGYRVAVVKHHPHVGAAFDLPGKDTWRLAQAGADQVLLSAPDQMLHRRSLTAELPLEELIASIEDVDLIITEGYKHGPAPKIEVNRRAHAAELVLPPEALLAVASDQRFDLPLPQFDLDDVSSLADLIEGRLLCNRRWRSHGKTNAAQD